MKPVRPAQRLPRAIAAIGAMLAAASCAGAPESGPARSAAFDGDAAQVLRYCEKLQDAGDLLVAAGICRRAHEMEPRNPEPLLRLAEIMLRLQNPRMAASAYRTILAFDPNNLDALYGLGNTYVALEQYEVAVEQFEAALRHEPNDVRFYNALGVTKDQLGAHEDAQTYYRKGLEVSPASASLRNNLGLSLVLSGRHDEGIAILQELASAPGAGPTSRQNLALAYGVAGDTEAAATVAQIDLPPHIVQQNLEYYATLRAVGHNGRSKPQDMTHRGPQAVAALPGRPQDATIRRPVGKPTPLVDLKPGAKADSGGSNVQEPVAPTSNDDSGTSGTTTSKSSGKEAPRPGKDTAATQTAAKAPSSSEKTETSLGMPASAKDSASQKSDSKAAASRIADPAELQAARGKGVPAGSAAGDTAQPNTSAKHGEATSAGTTDTARAKPAEAKPGAEAAKAPEQAAQAYAIQLGSYHSETRARQGWQELRVSATGLLDGFEPLIHRAEVGADKQVYYRLHTAPAASEPAAKNLCAELKKRQIDCLVVKAQADVPAPPRSASDRKPEPEARQEAVLPSTPPSRL